MNDPHSITAASTGIRYISLQIGCNHYTIDGKWGVAPEHSENLKPDVLQSLASFDYLLHVGTVNYLIHPDHTAVIEHASTILLQGQPIDLNLTVIAPGGQCYTVSGSGALAKDGANTETPDPTVTPEGNLYTGVWAWLPDNDAFYCTENLLGIRGESKQMRFDAFLEYIHADDREAVRTAFTALKQTHEALNITFRIVRKDDGVVRSVRSSGSHMPVPANGGYFVGTLQDVTPMPQDKTPAATDFVPADEQRSVGDGSLMKEAEIIGGIGSYEILVPSLEILFSDNMHRLLGRQPGGTVTLEEIDAISHPDDAVAVREIIGNAIETLQPYEYTRRIYRPWGEMRYINSHGRVITCADGHPVKVVGIARDITDAKVLEQALHEKQRESEDRRRLLQMTMDTSMDMIQVFEAIRNEAGEIVDFKWLLNNHTSEKTYGDTSGQSLLTRNPGVVAEGIFDAFKRVVETGIPDQHERHYVHEQFNGWFYQSTVKLNDGVATTTRDITERKKAEEEILSLKDEIAQRAEDKYRKLFETMEEGFAVCEVVRNDSGIIVDWRYIEVNHAVTKYAGKLPSELIGKLVSEALPGLNAWWIHTVARIVDTQQSEHFEQYNNVLDRWHESHMFPFGHERFGVVYHDTTQRKKAELVLRESEERKAFLLDLSDALNRLTDATEIKNTACTRLGRKLSASRVNYFDIVGDEFVADEGYNDGAPALTVGMVAEYGEVWVSSYRNTRLLISGNVSEDQRFHPHERERLLAVGIASFIVVMIVRDDRWVAAFGVHQNKPRQWKFEEVALTNDVAERIGEAAQRSRVEVELRRSEEKYRTLFESIDEGFCMAELVYDPTGRPVDLRFLEANRAYLRLTGQPQHVFGPRVSQRSPGVELYRLDDYDRVVKTGIPLRVENYYPGSERWYRIYASAVGEGSNQIAIVLDDVTEGKRLEKGQALLNEIARELEGLRTIHETMQRIGYSIGSYFNATWCMFAEVTDDPGGVIASYGWNAEGATPIGGVYRMPDFLTQEQLDTFSAGEQTVVNDTQEDVRVNAGRYAALGIRSFIIAPQARNAVWRFLLTVIHDAPRQWRTDEVELVRELSNRIWERIERAHAEEALRIGEERMRGLQEAFQKAVRGNALEDSLNILSGIVSRETSGAARSAFYLVGTDGVSLYTIRGAGDMPDSYADTIDGFPVNDDSFACGLAVAAARPVLTRDVLEEPRWDALRHVAEDNDFRACWSFPMKHATGTIGTFAMYFRQPREISTKDLALAEVITQAAAVIIASHTGVR